MTPDDPPVIGPSEGPIPDGEALDASRMSWAVLLARWTAFAGSAVAFPKDATGARWRASVAPSIGLQAVTFALADLERLAAPDVPLALDRAEMLIHRHASELHDAWRGEHLHAGLASLIEDARSALAAARGRGVEWIVTDARFVAPDPIELAQRLVEAGFDGEMLGAEPGAILFTGEPSAFFRPAPPDSIIPHPGCTASRAAAARQIYRQIDSATGLVSRDIVAPLSETLPAGRPLLAPIVDGGRIIARFSAGHAERLLEAQRRSLGPAPVEVIFGGSNQG